MATTNPSLQFVQHGVEPSLSLMVTNLVVWVLVDIEDHELTYPAVMFKEIGQ